MRCCTPALYRILPYLLPTSACRMLGSPSAWTDALDSAVTACANTRAAAWCLPCRVADTIGNPHMVQTNQRGGWEKCQVRGLPKVGGYLGA